MLFSWKETFTFISGCTLDKLQVDSFTITEVLRLQLLGSMALTCNPTGTRFRYLQRGGYTILDDVAIQLRQQKPELFEKLETTNIFDFAPSKGIQI